MICQCCKEKCHNDYFILDIERIKNGYPYFIVEKPKVVLCLDCYTELSKASNDCHHSHRKQAI